MTPSETLHGWLRRPETWLFPLLAFLALALSPGYVDNVDSRIILKTASRLLDAGTWSLGDVEGTYFALEEYGARGPDGEYYMKFGPGNALLALPFAALGRALLTGGALSASQAAEFAWSLAPALWFALSGVLVHRIARRVLSPRAALGAALLHCLAGYALAYGRSAYLETPLTVVVLSCFDRALAARDEPQRLGPPIALGALVGVALWVKVSSGIFICGIAPIVLTGSVRDVVRRALVSLVPLLVIVGGYLFLNHARFGDPFNTGYGASANFTTPLFSGVAGLLVGERGGLALYAPVAFLGLFGLFALWLRDRGLAAGIAIATGASLVLHGTFFSPFGGDAWGPRYLVPNAALLCVPGTLLLAAALRRGAALRAAAALTIALGVTLQLPSAAVSFSEIYTLKASVERTHPQAVDTLPGGHRLLVRILREKLRSPDGRYDLASVAGTAGRYQPGRVEQGLNWWPVRVARRSPRLAWLAWTAFFCLLTLAAGSALVLRRQIVRLPRE